MATHPANVLLELADVYRDLNNRPYSFVNQLSSGQPAVLENLRQITSLRATISKGAAASTATLDRVDRYLQLLLHSSIGAGLNRRCFAGS